MWERTKAFPKEVTKLYHEVNRYYHIQDAAKNTPRNAWSLKISGIPRRQWEQQRQIWEDLWGVIPIVMGYVVVPIFGNAFMILGVYQPRLFLSRQFHSDSEQFLFAALDSQENQRELSKLAPQLEALLKAQNTHHDPMMVQTAREMELFQLFFSEDKPINWDSLQRSYLIQMAVANGVMRPSYPSAMKHLYNACPAWCLKRLLRQYAKNIVQDDYLLLQDGYHNSSNNNNNKDGEVMTTLELVEACLRRGIPVTDNTESMRESLTNHLLTIQKIREFVRDEKSLQEALELYTLHLPMVRSQSG